MHPSRTVTLALLTLVLAGCTAQAPAPPAETVYVTQTAEPAAEDPAKAERTPMATEPAAEPASTEAETESVSPEPVVETFEMPALVGMNLQLAQDTLQSLDSHLLDQEDASGLDRFQVNDSNWQVCTQDPAPGSVVPVDTMVLLASVKLDETCP